ncbi:unnamed protein product [Chironomus riparius]|uniref:Uncharacterized protein n=1 Tax=Chironomus riparius TaxID=315576 RepID=A0A9N9RUV8_9DIPT|nr:unnamed protein product [Chironomus riparius]
MRIKFYILSRELQLYQCFLLGKDSSDSYLIGHKSEKQLYKNARVFKLNSYALYLFLNEIQCCPNYHSCVARNIKSSSSQFIIQLMPNKIEYIDRIWGEIVRQLVWEQLEVEYMMGWLSTLGGAFSALGDYFEDRAEIAGKISFHQMKLAYRLGDPNLLSRCKLFLSISLVQQNKFKFAQFIIKQQYQNALETEDNRLRKMCLGIWSKLQYTYKIHRQNRNKKKRCDKI